MKKFKYGEIILGADFMVRKDTIGTKKVNRLVTWN